ncbi:MAG: ParB/RepB/Spo0J family partition protein [Paludibacteraceae bacterium]|nr:ParB/RepB/Spo0J family partition protein [Paludibacteraceae bacterium]
MAKNIGLGRGLGALMEMDSLGVSGTSSINEVELSLILPNPHQPRSHFDEESLAELASSIKELGVISPITLRKNEDNTYMIIAGERRYRAAKSLGLKTIPAYVKTAADDQVMEMALIENIQREDLNAIEIALTFFRLIQEYKLTQERLSERVGKKRATIANYLRLLHLPAEIQMGLKNRKIDMGHARAILGIAEPAVQLKLYNLILKNNYPVRMIEEMVRNYAETGNLSGKQPALRQPKLNDLKELGDLKNQLSQIFNTKVQLTCDEKGKGKITIPFADDEQLMKIMQLIDRI